MASVRQIAENGVETEWPVLSDRDTAARPVARRGYLSRIAGAWRAVLKSAAPVGYEDETGFHYGTKTDRD